MSSLNPPSPTDPLLTPNTLYEAEMALRYNELYQTSSAGRPQPTTPMGPSRQPSNYYAAALKHGIDPSAPRPPSFLPTESTDSSASVDYEDDGLSAGALSPGKLSRGTTQAVLQKMASPEFDSSLLRKRSSREGERRTRLVPVKSGESIPDTAFDGPGAGDGGIVDGGVEVKKPGFGRQGSWSQEDMKRAMTERLMGPVGEEESAGYSSAGGRT